MWAEVMPYLAPGGAVTILGGAVWMVLTGRLIPASTHERELASKQAEIDRLHLAVTKAEMQRDKVMGFGHDVATAVIQAIPAAAKEAAQ